MATGWHTVDLLTFIRGMVEPPKNIRVNNIIISVVDSITVLVSTSNSMCKLRAKAMAPRKPETHKNSSSNKQPTTCTLEGMKNKLILPLLVNTNSDKDVY